ncbi:hypothetical protein ACOSQ2_001551 [Xanthoceras sorbifolium]
MSASSVCQGLQSCLEPRLIEPRVLRLKLAPPNSIFSRSVSPTPGFSHPDDLNIQSHTEENNTGLTANTENKNSCEDCDVKTQSNVDVRGWSFLQSLSNTTENNKETIDKEKVYVHPLVKRSASKLSEKSLEMCTESLGSETGSQVSESSDDISLISLETEICTTRDPPKPREISVTRKMNRSVSFPPPLTSISGSNGVKVRPHREGGRLVLEAVAVTTSHTYFHAERSDGRLRLCMLKACPPNMDNEDDPEEEDPEEDGGDDDEEEEEEEFDEEVKWGEDIEDDNEKFRGQIRVKKLPRPSRCKEGGCAANRGLLNWDSFWVATST